MQNVGLLVTRHISYSGEPGYAGFPGNEGRKGESGDMGLEGLRGLSGQPVRSFSEILGVNGQA